MNNYIMNLFRFEKISIKKMFLIGFSAILLCGITGSFSGVSNDGVLDIHIRKHSLAFGLAISLTSWLLISFFSWISGIIFSKSKIRIVDVAAMMAYARTPFLLIVLGGFLLPKGYFNIGDLSSIIPYIVFGLFALAVLILSVYLMWKAFSIACNLFKSKGIIIFILVLLLAETASFGANYFFSKEIEKIDILSIEKLDLK